MNTLNSYIAEYVEYCEYRKRLDSKTLKAYKIDLKQYKDFCTDISDCFSRSTVDNFITNLHKQYKPKTVKRKIASLKAFFITWNIGNYWMKTPFAKLDIRFREAKAPAQNHPFSFNPSISIYTL